MLSVAPVPRYWNVFCGERIAVFFFLLFFVNRRPVQHSQMSVVLALNSAVARRVGNSSSIDSIISLRFNNIKIFIQIVSILLYVRVCIWSIVVTASAF